MKPSNVFLDAGRPKLMDFGIACQRDRRASAPGTVSGTPCYMSPEQALGSDQVDYRSDLWSVCATLYELLSGRPPFEGTDCHAVLCAVLKSEPRPLAELGVGDAALASIVLRGLRKAPAERWRSSAELAAALSGWLLASGVDSDASGQSLRARWLPRAQKAERPTATGRRVDVRTRAYAALAGVLLIGSAAWAAVRSADGVERSAPPDRALTTQDRQVPLVQPAPAVAPAVGSPEALVAANEPEATPPSSFPEAAPEPTAPPKSRVIPRVSQPTARVAALRAKAKRTAGENAMGYDFGF